ncbi:MAG: hypothetical protein ACRES8_01800 [Nevskiaceae bacterium]
MDTPNRGANNPVTWIVAGGLIAGALDITFACGYWAIARDVPPERILQSVAAGVLGKASFQGGWSTGLLGLGLHFFITLMMAAAYGLVARSLPVLWQRPVAMGALYGLALYAIMHFVVVPLSNVPGGSGPGNNLWTWLGVAAHVLLVGIPIALCAREALRPR